MPTCRYKCDVEERIGDIHTRRLSGNVLGRISWTANGVQAGHSIQVL